MPRLRWLSAAGLLLGSVAPASAQSGTLTVDPVRVRARRWLGPATLYHYLWLESDTGADAANEASAPSGPPAKMDSGVGCS